MRDRRVTRHADLWPAPEFVRRHHPDYNKLQTQGWKAVDVEGKLPSVYHDGGAIWRLAFAEARRLRNESGASDFAVQASG